MDNDIFKVYNGLNYAYSINYTILENLNRIFSDGKYNVMLRDDIFGRKSCKEEITDARFHRFAEYRNKNFAELRESFNEFDIYNVFKNNIATFIKSYENICKIPANFNEVFPNSESVNTEKFLELNDNVNYCDASDKDKTKFFLSAFNMMNFYSQFKIIISAIELFDTLERDINSYGSKSIYYGKPDNPNIRIITRDQLIDLEDAISDFYKNNKKQIERIRNELNKYSPDLENEELVSATDSVARAAALDTIETYLNLAADRIEAANTSVVKNNLANKIFSHIMFPESSGKKKFKVNEIYVHTNELETFYDALMEFEQLKPLAEKVWQIHGGEKSSGAKFSALTLSSL